MRSRACIALLLFLSACASSTPSPNERGTRSQRLANLQRAATLPWTDGGRCVVREASQPWPALVERCYRTLDHDRLKFHDTTGRCTVASADAAVVGIGFCVLAAPEIAVGAVIVLGVVVVGVAIKEALDAYELRHAYPEEAGTSRGTKVSSRGAEAQDRPKLKPEPSGQDWLPPMPPESPERKRSPECKPVPVSHRGGNDNHNRCADAIKNNSVPGWDVLVNGKQFDALVLSTRTLWEVKTDDFDIQSLRSQRFFAKVKLPEIQREKRLAEACGYHFAVGVRSAAHKAALLELDRSLKVVVMDWC
ncbi:hypothetical protein EJ065_2779 [Corallococcus coralloides]|uniref:DUF6310 domain-containing protein n=1 Tax=Corallococcus coralloides TaxID=184914 RepID=A0A410RRD6_CORCK|nr:DUF6310 domain-containing protein [Corallococcus coralloides]QAT84351.1 hypothetical protein EJ065_2779 [Corallococcus coralloides]